MRFTLATKNLTKLLDFKSMKLLDHYASFNPSPLSVGQFIDFGQNATESDSFHFLVKELPVRMSNIMKEINLLPSNLLHSPSVIDLQQWYATSFQELCAFEGTDSNPKILSAFQKTLNGIQDRHVNVVQTMAQGVLELRESHSVDLRTEMSIQYFLDRFYMSRISMKVLIQQHIALFEPREAWEIAAEPTKVGYFDTNCKIPDVLHKAYTHASFLCEEYYDVAPDVNVHVACTDEDLEIAFLPAHLYHILFELFKNSMRATVENRRKGAADVPDIEVLLTKGQHDITIRISDQGGGISRSVTDHLFHYLFSTAPRPSMTPEKTPLAGYGFGLPLSRLYARFFHGDLVLNSYDGYGTDAVIYLKIDNSDACELLPVFNKTSTKQYKASVPAADWTDPTSVMNAHYRPQVLAGYYRQEAKKTTTQTPVPSKPDPPKAI